MAMIGKQNETLLKKLAKEQGTTPNKLISEFLAPYKIQTDSTGLSIALENTDNNGYETQEKWISVYNERDQIMMSAPDIARAGLTANTAHPDSALLSLRKDFKDSYVVTSTQNDFCHADKNLADIVHYVGSTVVKPIMHKKIFIPVIQGEFIEKALSLEGGLNYMEKETGLKGKTEIIDSMVGLSQREPKDIFVYTPTLESRANYSKRAVRFGESDGGFLVIGDIRFDGDVGRSRRVHASESPRSGRATKK